MGTVGRLLTGPARKSSLALHLCWPIYPVCSSRGGRWSVLGLCCLSWHWEQFGTWRMKAQPVLSLTSPQPVSLFWIKTFSVMWEADSSGIFSVSLLDHIKIVSIRLDHVKSSVRWAVECGGVYLSDKWPCLSECSDYIAVLPDFQKQLCLLVWIVVSPWHLPSLKVTQGKGGEIVWHNISLFSPVFPGEFPGEFPAHRCFLFTRTFCLLNCSFFSNKNNGKIPLGLEVLRHY